MNPLDPKTLRSRTAKALGRASFSPQKFILIYALVLTLPTLLLNGVSYGLNEAANRMTGLNEASDRNMLISLDMTLGFIWTLFQFFWTSSYVIFTLRVSRGENCSMDTLWDGFRLWKRVVGYNFWVFVRLFTLSMGFCLVMMLVGVFSIPLMILISAGYLMLMVMVYYQLFLVKYMAFDDLSVPTAALCSLSTRLTKGRKLQIFRVQLHFFWYFIPLLLAQLGPSLVLDLISLGVLKLPLLPVFAGAALVQSLAPLALYLWKGNEVNVTLAMAYNAILEDTMPHSAQKADEECLPECIDEN